MIFKTQLSQRGADFMRNEQEMFDLIINTAKEEDLIRAVYMNGSHTNPTVPKDIFQDYDIVYVVKDTAPFIKDKNWINKFGQPLFMQCPDEMDAMQGKETDFGNIYGWLIQFSDGNRLDLHVESIAHAKVWILKDKLCKVLLDKDCLFPAIPPSTEEDYYVKKPSKGDYLCTCDEFWWCLDNVAKGLWRNEMPYVQDMLNYYIRPQLVKMLSWRIGIHTDYSCSIGKSGKYMFRWLSKEEWDTFLGTYSSCNVSECWDSVMKMCQLFHTTASSVGKDLGFTCNIEEAENCMAFLEHVKGLPKDAVQIF